MRAQDAFYIKPLNIEPGDTKTLCLSLDNSGEYKGFQTDLVLPTGLTVATNTKGVLDISLTDRASSSFSLSSNEIREGTIRMVCFSSQNATFSRQSGQLVKISVKASDDFTGGYVSLQNSIFSDTNDKDVKMADCKVLVSSKEQNYLTIANGELAAGKGASFPLMLHNDGTFTAYQLDVVLPSGLTLDLGKCSMSERCSDTHQLTTKDIGNGTYRFICMSMDNATFSDNEGSILNLWIQSDTESKGEKIITVKNVVFSDAKAKSYSLENVSFHLDVKYIAVSSISLSEYSTTLRVGALHQLQATVLPDNASDKSIVWETSDSSIATVDDNGNVVAVSQGKCTITAYSADRSVKATCNIAVEKNPLTAKVQDATRVYGDENPVFKISYTGFLDGDSEATFSVKPTFNTTANITSNVGTYEISAEGGVSDKYDITYEAATLTITKAPLTISAGNYTKKQGDAMPAFKASYAGFKNGENESVLIKQPVFSCEATEASAPGDYAVTASGAEAQNYEISYVEGKLTVVQADAVIIRAKSCTRTYGDDNPAFEYEVEGATLDGTPEITCVADKTSAVGTYAIEVKQGTVKNYNVSYIAATLTITKAPLTISAGNYTKKQGDAMPAFKASYAGFKNGENESVLIKQPVFSCEATEASAPGDYAVTASGAEAQNYEISYVEGNLKILDSRQTITWDKNIEPKTETTYTMNATASSGLPITYSYMRPMSAWQCPVIDGAEVTFTTEGRYLIIATQSGNEEYDAVSDTLEVCALASDDGLMYIDGIYYKYADNGHTTLKVVRGYKTYRGNVVIPETVNGLPVVEIDNWALYACYFLDTVTVGDNVTKFGHEALGADSYLKNVTLPYKATSLPNYLFNCDKKLAEIHCRSSIPYTANENLFNGYVDYSCCILYVPTGTKDAYAAHELWGKFANIVEENVETGIFQIEDIVNDNGAWYTITGVKLPGKPKTKGVYIHNGKKVFVK